jgi:hypothetical protein
MKGLPQKTPDFNEANTEEINLTILGVLEEVCGSHLCHQITDERVDILLDTGQNEPILISLDDVKPDMVEFVKGLKHGEKVGIFRLDAPQQFFLRRVETSFPTKVRE